MDLCRQDRHYFPFLRLQLMTNAAWYSSTKNKIGESPTRARLTDVLRISCFDPYPFQQIACPQVFDSFAYIG